jgi:hypothetical protein
MVVARFSIVFDGTSRTAGAARAVAASNEAVRRIMVCILRNCNPDKVNFWNFAAREARGRILINKAPNISYL